MASQYHNKGKSMNAWFAYFAPFPVDDFQPLQTLSETENWLVRANTKHTQSIAEQPHLYFDATMEVLVEHQTVHHIDHFHQHYTEALLEAEKLGYAVEETRHEPYVFWLPSPQGYCLCGFVFKNNGGGDTFVVSPVALPFLHEKLAD